MLLQVLGSLKCDCREQLELAMDYIRDAPPGVQVAAAGTVAQLSSAV